MVLVLGALSCKVSQNLSLCNPPRAGNCFVSLSMTLMNDKHIRRSSL